MTRPTDDPLEKFMAALGGVNAFAEEMRQAGIHVGLGSPPSCVICGGVWPCTSSKLDTTP